MIFILREKGIFAVMGRLTDEITGFLRENGFRCKKMLKYDVAVISAEDRKSGHLVLPVEISACNPEQARTQSLLISRCIENLLTEGCSYPLIITEDRWNRQNGVTKDRLLAHLGVFVPVYARNCEIRRIEKDVAREFLERNHSYGFSSCRYCYGLFFKRHTGHNASSCTITQGSLVAVASFSNARRWKKGEKEIRSYEWTRYASLPSLRISGGMGRLLKAFIEDIKPDDIMSYADLEWSEGKVYEQLGFKSEGRKNPVCFSIDTQNWVREAVREGNEKRMINFRNLGSAKYRLKLTVYE